MPYTNPGDAHFEWLDELAGRPRFGPKNPRGTANYIDDAARQRAATAIKTGRCVSLARPLVLRDDERAAQGLLSVDVSIQERTFTMGDLPSGGATYNSGSDVVRVSAHGQSQTHMDGINHIGRHGQWYSGFPVDEPEGPTVADLANHKLFTRGVIADIPAVRGTEWVDPSAPVTSEDIDAALDASGVRFEPGDALILYIGRDRYEAAGNHMDVVHGTPSPGAGTDAAHWIAEHGVALLCWDFLDAVHESQPPLPVHMLIWAIGLVLVDNCDLTAAIHATKESRSIVGGLVVAPPPLPLATGSLVDPLFIQ